jgi:hypothetical protein
MVAVRIAAVSLFIEELLGGAVDNDRQFARFQSDMFLARQRSDQILLALFRIHHVLFLWKCLH